MTHAHTGSGTWQPPAAASEAAHTLFQDVIPDLAAVAADYRVSLDVLDADIFAAFCAHFREILSGLATAVAASDEATTRGYAHSLEGMGGTVGFPELSAVGVALSRAAKTGAWPVCRILCERLEQWRQVVEFPETPKGGARE